MGEVVAFEDVHDLESLSARAELRRIVDEDSNPYDLDDFGGAKPEIESPADEWQYTCPLNIHPLILPLPSSSETNTPRFVKRSKAMSRSCSQDSPA